MIDLKSKKAVFFDFGDTLTTTVDTYPKRIHLSLKENGYSYSDDEFINAYLRSDYDIFKYYIQNKSLKQSEHQKLLYKFLVKNLNINEDSEEIMRTVKKTLKEIEYERINLPGCTELLDNLKSKNYILAIISNNDGKTEQKTIDVGIRNYFDLVVDSTKVKIVKPNREIFDLALKTLGLKNSEVIHIGDLYGSDILGAKNAEIEPIWINHRNAENYESLDIKIVKDLLELNSFFS